MKHAFLKWLILLARISLAYLYKYVCRRFGSETGLEWFIQEHFSLLDEVTGPHIPGCVNEKQNDDSQSAE